MTATKAVVGGLAGQVIVLLMHLLDLVPFVQTMPPPVHAALENILAYGVIFAGVYLAPANIPRPPADAA